MTATTPSMRAVRFETGLIELELSNRIQCKTQPGGSSSYLKLFGKCQVDLNLALGQIVKHQVGCLTTILENTGLDVYFASWKSFLMINSSDACSVFAAGVWRSGFRLPPGGIFPNSDRSAKRPAGGDQWLLRQRGCSHHAQQANSVCPAGCFWQRLVFLLFPCWQETHSQQQLSNFQSKRLSHNNVFLCSNYKWETIFHYYLYPSCSCAVLAKLQGCLWQLEWTALGP